MLKDGRALGRRGEEAFFWGAGKEGGKVSRANR